MSAVSFPVCCPFLATSSGNFSSGLAAVGAAYYFYVGYHTCSLPPPAPGAQELVIFENMTQGSRAQPALEDSCCHRRGSLQLGTPLAALAGMTWITNALDQQSQLMWATVAAGPTVTLGQLVLDFKVQMFVSRVDEQFVHFWF
jgi:hypothetical protein